MNFKFLCVLQALLLLIMVSAKDKDKFKSCKQLPFCFTHRNIQEIEPKAVTIFILSIFFLGLGCFTDFMRWNNLHSPIDCR